MIIMLEISVERTTGKFASEDDVDIDIPGSKFGFSVLKQSQALGDMQALQSRKRPFVSVHLEDDVTANLRALVKAVRAGLAAESGASSSGRGWSAPPA